MGLPDELRYIVDGCVVVVMAIGFFVLLKGVMRD